MCYLLQQAYYHKKYQQDDSHFTILGVSSNASKEEIKTAYRNACKKYHPDKVHHLGEEFKKVAEEKMQKINESYSRLIKQHS